MRDPHCLKCGKLITHFGKGWKFSVVKREGGYYHEECYIQHMNRPRKLRTPEQRSIENHKYYQKHKEYCKKRRLDYYYNVEKLQ